MPENWKTVCLHLECDHFKLLHAAPDLEELSKTLQADEDHLYNKIETLANRAKSNNQYLSLFTRLDKFLDEILDDQESRLILRREAPRFFPPIAVRSLILFLRLNTTSQDANVLDVTGHNLISKK